MVFNLIIQLFSRVPIRLHLGSHPCQINPSRCTSQDSHKVLESRWLELVRYTATKGQSNGDPQILTNLLEVEIDTRLEF